MGGSVQKCGMGHMLPHVLQYNGGNPKKASTRRSAPIAVPPCQPAEVSVEVCKENLLQENRLPKASEGAVRQEGR
jgi:hypothetical protein